MMTVHDGINAAKKQCQHIGQTGETCMYCQSPLFQPLPAIYANIAYRSDAERRQADRDEQRWRNGRR